MLYGKVSRSVVDRLTCRYKMLAVRAYLFISARSGHTRKTVKMRFNRGSEYHDSASNLSDAGLLEMVSPTKWRLAYLGTNDEHYAHVCWSLIEANAIFHVVPLLCEQRNMSSGEILRVVGLGLERGWSSPAWPSIQSRRSARLQVPSGTARG